MELRDKIKALREAGYIEGELSVDPLWYQLWEPEHIDGYNNDYELAKYAPGFIAFGSNGGGELLVTNKNGEVFSLPAIGMAPGDAWKIADSIDELVKFMHKGN